jgi:hypothetical protein
VTRKSASPTSRAPRFVQHPKRPAWGVGQILDEQHGVVRVHFSDGVIRSFRGDVLEPAEAPENPLPIAPSNDVAVEPAPKRPRKTTAKTAKPAKAAKAPPT